MQSVSVDAEFREGFVEYMAPITQFLAWWILFHAAVMLLKINVFDRGDQWKTSYEDALRTSPLAQKVCVPIKKINHSAEVPDTILYTKFN